MKKYICLLLACVIGAFLLTGCGVKYESTDYHFTVTFPEDMTVLVPGVTGETDPALEQFDISYETLTEFKANQSGVYYGVREVGKQYTEVLVAVSQDDVSKDVWHLKESDTDIINSLQEDTIATLNTSGAQVLKKGTVPQGKAYGLYLKCSDRLDGQMNFIYWYTIYNGYRYSIIYQTAVPMSEEETNEATDLFDSFYITETLASPNAEPEDTTVVKAVLVVVLILVGVVIMVLLIRMLLVGKKPKETNEAYISQFEDQLKTRRKSGKKEE